MQRLSLAGAMTCGSCTGTMPPIARDCRSVIGGCGVDESQIRSTANPRNMVSTRNVTRLNKHNLDDRQQRRRRRQQKPQQLEMLCIKNRVNIGRHGFETKRLQVNESKTLEIHRIPSRTVRYRTGTSSSYDGFFVLRRCRGIGVDPSGCRGSAFGI